MWQLHIDSAEQPQAFKMMKLTINTCPHPIPRSKKAEGDFFDGYEVSTLSQRKAALLAWALLSRVRRAAIRATQTK
jgi:hypothetical protein